jgi:hypothetical protein
VEALVVMLLGVIVLTGIYELLMSQTRLYAIQKEVMDARESLRAAGALLSWELTGASATRGDLYAIGATAITVRSLQGIGVICATAPGGRFGLQQVSGSFYATADDSVLAYSVADDAWAVLGVSGVWSGATAWDPAPGGGGTPVCFWGDSTATVPRPQVALELQGDSASLAGLPVGSPIRSFRRTEYGLLQQAGRWWLGRRLGAAGSYEILTGPMRAPADSGLVFTYYDAMGAVTAVPAQVAEVVIVLRAESFGRARAAGYQAVRDSLTFRIALRNNATP